MALLPRWRYMTDEAKALTRRSAVSALVVLAVLLGLTGFGIYLAFGPPSKGLTDPFDDHDD